MYLRLVDESGKSCARIINVNSPEEALTLIQKLCLQNHETQEEDQISKTGLKKLKNNETHLETNLVKIMYDFDIENWNKNPKYPNISIKYSSSFKQYHTQVIWAFFGY